MTGTRLGALVAVLLLAPVTAAESRFLLQGDLLWLEAASTTGILMPTDAQGLVMSVQPQTSPDPVPPLVHGMKAHLKLISWTEFRPVLPPPPSPLPNPGSPESREWVLDGPELTWISNIGRPQLLAMGRAAQVDATACDLTVPDEDEKTQFPVVTTGPSARTFWSEAPRNDQLQAECGMGSMTLENPDVLLIYGMKVHVVGRDFDEIIATGTFDDDVGTASSEGRAVLRQRTQVLQVSYEQEPFSIASAPGKVKIYASHFMAEGRLDMPHSQGHLVWGARDETGDVHPVVADGTFDLRRGADDHAVVSGRTLTAPVVAASTVEAPAFAMPPAAAAVAAGLLALAGAAWFLFSKIDAGDIPTHPRRRLILDIVHADPGVGTNSLARILNLRWPGVAYHLGRLERAGHVVVRRVGGRTAVFPAAGFRGKEIGVVLLRQETPRRTLDLIRERPGLDQPGLAAALGLHQSQVSRVLKALRNAGFVQTETRAARTVYTLVPPSAASVPTAVAQAA